ncbi:ABC transporter permease [Dactylosporangium sp. NPDC051484]|uniref:ABC transporter permease n=1 Tax=Dactylosporangium sp. NPDC051484 TaxID=3154942 RepID=UPI00344F9C76
MTATTVAPAPPAEQPGGGAVETSLLRGILRRTSTVVAAGFLLLLIVVAILAPVVAPHDPNAQDVLSRLRPPGGDHPLGTDDYGRDVLSRIIFGARVSLVAAVQAAGLALVIGLPLGIIAGYVRGWLEVVLVRVMDALMSTPSLVLAITIVAVLGPGITNAMIAIGLIMSPRFFRVARASTMNVRHETYIEASVALGCTGTRTVVRHILPNVLPPIVLVTSVSLGAAVAAESSLSFLGLGVKPPAASWGSMLTTAAANMDTAPFMAWPPGIMIFLTVLSFTYLGDGVRRGLTRTRAE